MSKKTKITEDWQPDEAGAAFADANGVPETEIGAFVDYHLAHGSLMASWPAAWRTWCRNAVKFGTATGKPKPAPLILAFDQADAYGAQAWVHTLRDAHYADVHGKMVPCILGIDAAGTAVDVCTLAGFDPSDRPDLTPIAQWLREGIAYDLIMEAVRGGRRPDRPVLRYFEGRLRELLARKVA